MPPTVDVRRSSERACTASDGVLSRHSLSTGRHYDPDNTSFGRLALHDEHLLAPGAGFPLHRHRDVDVVTWVLEGTLTHEDSTGARTHLRPGVAQVLAAGAGVAHEERNDAAPGGPAVRFVQAWVVPDVAGGPTGCVSRDVGALLGADRLVRVASGHGDVLLPLGARTAALHVGRIGPGPPVRLPVAGHVHVFVARGEVELDGAGRLGAGDAVRLTGADGASLSVSASAEVLVWEMDGSLAG